MEFSNGKENICKIVTKQNSISLANVALRYFQVETAIMYAQQFGQINF